MALDGFKELFWAIATSLIDWIIPVFVLWLLFSWTASLLFKER